MMEPDAVVSVLEEKISYCPHCDRQTGYDGWDVARGGTVTFYCEGCGKCKVNETSPFKLLSQPLQREILSMMAETHEA